MKRSQEIMNVVKRLVDCGSRWPSVQPLLIREGVKSPDLQKRIYDYACSNMNQFEEIK